MTFEQFVESELRELVQLIDNTSTKLIGPDDGPEMKRLAVEILIWRLRDDYLRTNWPDAVKKLDEMVRDVAKKIGFEHQEM